MRLVASAIGAWDELDGYAVSQNMPPMQLLPLDRFLHFVWHMLVRNADRKERTKMEAKLWAPPPEERGKPISPKSPWSAENEMKSFQALQAALTGGTLKQTKPPAEPEDRTPPRRRVRADGRAE
jgi:hypothetical protein